MGGGSALDNESAATLADQAQGTEQAAEGLDQETRTEPNTDLQQDLDEVGIAMPEDGADAAIIPAATQRVNEDVTLSTRTVAQAESTRSYFLAQTLESTRTVPIVSANLPLDTTASEPQAPEADVPASDEGEEGEGSDDPDPAAVSNAIAAESTVVGSFVYRGITYAVEPGGESVAVVAADYAKLPEEFIEAQTIVLPSMVTSDGIDYYSVTRIADYAFTGLSSQHVISSEGDEVPAVEKSALIEQNEGEALASSREDAETSDDETVGITAITVPASVISIGDDAFTGFDTLQYVIVSEDNPNYGMYDGCLYDADLTSLLLIPEGRLGAVWVAPSVVTIDPSAFSHCAVDTVIADPDSAAYQLLSEGDFYNAKNVSIGVATEDRAIQQGLELFQLNYPELVEENSLQVDDAFESIETIGQKIEESRSTYGAQQYHLYNPKATTYKLYVGAPKITYCATHFQTAEKLIRGKIVSSAGWISKSRTTKPYFMEGSTTIDGRICSSAISSSGATYCSVDYSPNTPSTSDADRYKKPSKMEYWDPYTRKWIQYGTAVTPNLTELYIRLDGYNTNTPSLPIVQHTITWDSAAYGGSFVSNANSLYAGGILSADSGKMQLTVDCESRHSASSGGEAIDVPGSDTVTAPEGFVFKGWALRSGGTTTNPIFSKTYKRLVNGAEQSFTLAGDSYLKYEDGTGRSVVIYDDTTFYAVWTIDVSWATSKYGGELSGGSTATTTSVIVNTVADLPAVADMGTGWKFEGWIPKNSKAPESGSSSYYKDGTKPTITATMAAGNKDGAIGFEGVWSLSIAYQREAGAINEMTIDGASDSGTGTLTKTGIIYGSTVTAPTTQSPASHHFSHWTTADGTNSTAGANAAAAHTLVITAPGAVTAHWAPNERDVLLNGNGADATNEQYVWAEFGATMSTTLSSGGALQLPTRAGYVFAGYWNTRYTEVEGATEVVPTTKLKEGSTTDYETVTVKAKRYYGVNDAQNPTAFANLASWDITNDSQQLFAHWKYKIVLDANVPAGAAGADNVKLRQLSKVGDYTGSALAGSFAGDVFTDSSYGNVYHFQAAAGEEPAHTYLVQADEIAIDAIAGAPVKLPFAIGRTGYDDTVVWKCADTVVPVTRDGWTSATLGGTSVSGMVFAGNPDTTTHIVTLYADWSGDYEEEGFGGGPKKYTVNLVAAYDGITLTGANETAGTTKLSNVEYDKAFSASVKDKMVTAPFRNGYTFLGYYAEEHPDVTGALDPQETRWVNAATGKLADTARVSDTTWNVVPAAGQTEITLYAAWKKDSYTVAFAPTALSSNGADSALTPGTQQVITGSTLAPMMWSYGEKMALRPAFPKAAATPSDTVSADTPFYRNGYTFDGWYFVTDTATQMVSDGLGQGHATYAWTPSREWQVANREASDAAVTLYAAWTPKTYAVMFDLNLPDGTASVAYPLESWFGDAAHKNVEKTTDGRYYYKVAYEDSIAPYFNDDGERAVPSHLDYDFAYWGTDKDEAATVTSPKNKLVAAAGEGEGTYLFMPAAELRAANGNNGQVNIITYYGHWTSPDAARVTLFADAPERTTAATARGSFTSDNIDYTDASAESDAAHLLLTDVPYGVILPINGQDAYHPSPAAGYIFKGWVRTNADGTTVEDPYDATTGEPKTSMLVKDADLKYLKGTNAFVAVYSRASYTVKLDMAGYDSYSFTTEGPVTWEVLTQPFNVESGAFSLPTDVVVAGKKFAGWKRTKPAPEKMWNGYTIDPVAAAAEANAQAQEFVPMFVDRIYRVDFRANNVAGGEGDVLTAYVDYDGHVLGGSLVDAGQAKMGDTLGMPAAPKARLSSTTVGADGTYMSSLFSAWRIGTKSVSQGVDRKANDMTLTKESWNGWLTNPNFVKSFATVQKVTLGGKEYEVTNTMDVHGIWSDKVSAVCPLYVNLVVDVETGAVAIPDSDFGIYGTSSTQKLSVAALRYESVVETDAQGKGNSFATAAEPVHLSVFVGTPLRPEMKTPEIENGVIKGAFGKQTSAAHAAPLSIDLTQASRVYTADDLASGGHGFTTFTNDGDSNASDAGRGELYIWYGLDLDGVKLDTLRTIGNALPKIQDGYAIESNGWTKDSVKVARLLYTVQLAD